MSRLILLSLTLLSLYWAAPAQASPAPHVVNGIIDLNDWDFLEGGPVSLSGDYEFYWNRQLSSNDFLQMDTSHAATIPVPGAWNGAEIDGEEIGGLGYATYRLNLLTSRRKPLALEIPDIGTAYRLIVNGRILFQAGQPGTTRATTIPRYDPTVVEFTPAGNRTEIIFQVSNFQHRLGGIWLPVLLGTPKQIHALHENQLARDLILFGAIFIIGLYNLVLYFLRRENRSSLFLGLFCLLLALRILMVGDRFMSQLMPGIPFAWYLRIEYLSWYLAVPAFAAFIRSLFPLEMHRFGAMAIHAAFGIGALTVLVTPPWIFSWTVPGYQTITVAGLLYGTWVLILAALRKREGAYILLFAYCFLFYTSFSDILVSAGIINNVLLLDIGLFVFILCQSVLISYRFT
ncbi:MAG TPA: 7TM-DISM domain-containing protein, partial [Pseudomonadales bacterium]|nr:7TM-DISM domain-containing protein [Pseudomonadales bacterium]